MTSYSIPDYWIPETTITTTTIPAGTTYTNTTFNWVLPEDFGPYNHLLSLLFGEHWKLIKKHMDELREAL